MSIRFHAVCLLPLLHASAARADVVITEVLAATATGENRTDEYVEICNMGTAAVDLSGWTITDGDQLDDLLSWSDHPDGLADGWAGDLVLEGMDLGAGDCALVLDPNYLEGTLPYDLERGTLILTVDDTAIGEGLGTTDPITLFHSGGTTSADVASTYGTPVDSDLFEERDDDYLDDIPLDPPEGRSAYRVNLFDADKESNWLVGAPTPGFQGIQGTFEVAADGSTDYPTLIGAVRVALAGSEILVHPGVYVGDLELLESVTIAGVSDYHSAVVDGDIGIYANNGAVGISGLSINGAVTIDDAIANLRANLVYEGSVTYHYSTGEFIDNVMQGGTGLVLQYYSSPEVRGNEFVDTTDYGLYCFHGSEPLVTENIFRSSEGVAIHCTAGPTIENNIIEGFDLGISLSSSSAYVQGNTVRGTTTAGAWISTSEDAVLEGNVFEDCGKGIHSSWSSPTLSSNLVFLGSDVGIEIEGGLVPDFYGAITANALVVGNTIVQQGGTGLLSWGSTMTGDVGRPTLANNLVALNEGPGISATEGEPVLTTNNSWGNTGSNLEGVTSESDLELDPLFSDVEFGDFTLAADSPLIDAGTVVDGISESDVTGSQRVHDGDGDGMALPDIGAFERCPDADGDGYFIDCQAEAAEDCDDTDASIYPDAEETWYDGIDQNCDGNDDDQDGDGVTVANDCDDTDPFVFEGCGDSGLDSGDSQDKGGDCSCSATPLTPSGLLVLLLGTAAVVRRRRS